MDSDPTISSVDGQKCVFLLFATYRITETFTMYGTLLYVKVRRYGMVRYIKEE
jgi:hypothetical protein